METQLKSKHIKYLLKSAELLIEQWKMLEKIMREDELFGANEYVRRMELICEMEIEIYTDLQ
jgi:hypothetical protein